MDGHPRSGLAPGGTELGLQAASLALPLVATMAAQEELAREALVIDYQNLRLLHHHGESWTPMRPRPDHDSAASDPERTMLRHGVVFRCEMCDEEVIVQPGSEGRGEPR